MKYITRTDLFGGSVFSEIDTKKKTKIYLNQFGEKTDILTVVPNTDIKKILAKVRIK